MEPEVIPLGGGRWQHHEWEAQVWKSLSGMRCGTRYLTALGFDFFESKLRIMLLPSFIPCEDPVGKRGSLVLRNNHVGESQAANCSSSSSHENLFHWKGMKG